MQIISAGMQAVSKPYVRVRQKEPSPLLFPGEEKDLFLMQKWCHLGWVLPSVLAQGLESLPLPLRDAAVCF